MKDGLAIMLGSPSKEGDKDEDKDEGGTLGAAKDILAAIKASDANALDAALKLHYEECEGASDEDDSEED